MLLLSFRSSSFFLESGAVLCVGNRLASGSVDDCLSLQPVNFPSDSGGSGSSPVIQSVACGSFHSAAVSGLRFEGTGGIEEERSKQTAGQLRVISIHSFSPWPCGSFHSAALSGMSEGRGRRRQHKASEIVSSGSLPVIQAVESGHFLSPALSGPCLWSGMEQDEEKQQHLGDHLHLFNSLHVETLFLLHWVGGGRRNRRTEEQTNSSSSGLSHHLHSFNPWLVKVFILRY